MTSFYSSFEEDPGVGYPSCNRELSRISPNNNDPNGYYRFLSLLPSASFEEIRRALRVLYKRYHPDGWDPNEEMFFRSKWIARILLDPRVKHHYDSTPRGYQFREPGDEGKEVIDEIPIEEPEKLLYDYFVVGIREDNDVELVQHWYESLISVSPIFGYTKVVKVGLKEGREPLWMNRSGMFIIPRGWKPTTANAFALFTVVFTNN